VSKSAKVVLVWMWIFRCDAHVAFAIPADFAHHLNASWVAMIYRTIVLPALWTALCVLAAPQAVMGNAFV